MLRSGRIAGLREHRGEVVCPAQWEPVIDPAERDRVLARMAERVAIGRRAPRRYVLSGLLRCGKCGGKLYASRRGTSRRYVCPDHGGCEPVTRGTPSHPRPSPWDQTARTFAGEA
jgi:hypothetical protein